MWWLPPINVATPNLITYLASLALSRDFHLLSMTHRCNKGVEKAWRTASSKPRGLRSIGRTLLLFGYRCKRDPS